MATPSDVISELIRLTESGELEWNPDTSLTMPDYPHTGDSVKRERLFIRCLYNRTPSEATFSKGWHRLDHHRAGRRRPSHCWTPSPGNTDKKARPWTKYWILPMRASQNPNRATKDDAHRVIGTRRSPGITGAFRYRRAVRPHPQGNQATHQAPSAALVAVHKNTKLVSQFSEPVTLGP